MSEMSGIRKKLTPNPLRFERVRFRLPIPKPVYRQTFTFESAPTPKKSHI